ncbi:glycerophosphoryl diester phosphodiesterase [Knoellia remsis]|uniref:Glycerophosphoryl diester phosphodiesterase n=1 Tax=Knoellia remsis TaxID=407159 RepID=A0A2T0UEJ3_9MICO|nr:glycerophosphodiester phosphodiesterase family protein [Knoellia remsis]PRY56349.1 glycerophosphoryl diester phosphodiesterase [Knoellia remsis]
MARAADFAYFDHDDPIAMAHRGGAAYGPNVGLENTLGAFRRAVAMGYRYLETDVHATADGELVAFHDSRLDRVTTGRGAVAELPYAVVREARINGTDAVPLLTELLEEFPDARLNIDIKAWAALEPTVEVIRAHDAVERVCIGSFSERRVRAARRALGPRLATAAGQVGTGVLRYAPGLVSRWLHTPAPVLQIPVLHRLRGREIRLVTPGLLAAAHRLGKQVHVWFHPWSDESAEEMNRLLDLGVDGIVTDHIATLRDVLAERGHPLAAG